MRTESKEGSMAETIDMFGGLCTWHTLQGRHLDIVARLVVAGGGTREVAEHAAGDAELQRERLCFTTWADAVGESLWVE